MKNSVWLCGVLLLACGGDTRQESGSADPTSASGITVNPDDGTDADDDGDNEDEGGEKLDAGSGETDGAPGGGDCQGDGTMMGEDVAFSYIWIANSPEGTVSKIDTKTGDELGRYVTGPPEQSEPSRTSVNLVGDVAVSNRGAQGGLGGTLGGVTKIAALQENCEDRNGDGMIQTSSGPTDVLAWGDDECVLWNLAVPSTGYETGVRPTAWEGTTTADGCADPNPRLWIGWYDAAPGLGTFHRLDGDSGDILDTVTEPWNGLTFGPYGGAVNQDGDFWVVGWQQGPLVRIDGDSLEVERVEMPEPPADQQWSYGMSLDQYGNPWIASSGAAATYNVQSGQWQFVSTGNGSMRGVMVDSKDRAWFAVDAQSPLTGGCGLTVVDVNTLEILAPAAALPGCVTPVGVSIDVEGFVWVVDQGANTAFKIDPDTYQLQLSVPGLVSPYTYSDMTGAGLNLVVNPPVG